MYEQEMCMCELTNVECVDRTHICESRQVQAGTSVPFRQCRLLIFMVYRNKHEGVLREDIVACKDNFAGSERRVSVEQSCSVSV